MSKSVFTSEETRQWKVTMVFTVEEIMEIFYCVEAAHNSGLGYAQATTSQQDRARLAAVRERLLLKIQREGEGCDELSCLQDGSLA